MRIDLAVVYLFTIGSTVNCQYNYWFKCVLPHNSCLNNGTCHTNGECSYIEGYSGYNCFKSANLTSCDEAPAITDPCQNEGSCYKSSENSTVALCACLYGYFGDTCDREIVETHCGNNTVEFRLSFPNQFVGEVRVGLNNEFNCKLPETLVLGRKTFSYIADIPIKSYMEAVGCENILWFDEDSNSYVTYVYVQFNPTWVDSLDDIYRILITCQL